MPATILGTKKGILTTPSLSATGIVFDSVDFDYTSESLPFLDEFGDTASVGYIDNKVTITASGFLLAGTAFTGTINSAITTITIPAHLPTGNTGGTAIIENIKIGQPRKDYQKVELTITYYPKVS